jgi:hypothetical protein
VAVRLEFPMGECSPLAFLPRDGGGVAGLVANMEVDGTARASDSADRLVYRLVSRGGAGTTEQQVPLLAREPPSGPLAHSWTGQSRATRLGGAAHQSPGHGRSTGSVG